MSNWTDHRSHFYEILHGFRDKLQVRCLRGKVLERSYFYYYYLLYYVKELTIGYSPTQNS